MICRNCERGMSVLQNKNLCLVCGTEQSDDGTTRILKPTELEFLRRMTPFVMGLYIERIDDK